MLEQIKNKSLDELEELMGGFSREHVDDDVWDDAVDAGDIDDEIGTEVLFGDEVGNNNDDSDRPGSFTTGRSIMAAFSRKRNDNEGRGPARGRHRGTTQLFSLYSIQ